MPKRLPLPPETLSSESERLYTLLNEADDFPAIVVAVSYVDACVASLLARKFAKGSTADSLLDSSSGAIGSFAVRAKMAYVLALIDKAMYQDLMVLAEMRNETAHHHFELSFESEVIIKHAENLKYIAGLKNGNTTESLFDESFLRPPRTLFMLTAIMIVNRLLLTALGTQHAAGQA